MKCEVFKQRNATVQSCWGILMKMAGVAAWWWMVTDLVNKSASYSIILSIRTDEHIRCCEINSETADSRVFCRQSSARPSWPVWHGRLPVWTAFYSSGRRCQWECLGLRPHHHQYLSTINRPHTCTCAHQFHGDNWYVGWVYIERKKENDRVLKIAGNWASHLGGDDYRCHMGQTGRDNDRQKISPVWDWQSTLCNWRFWHVQSHVIQN